ncbi:cyclase family protein [Symbioplanes lichenis]|uniref:cyclase family protein n=1 Tax=Symbioplanes lichenis TaxID=1629072 RepID=UPI00273A4EDF|nr:cyclase family protein [Actinoplanes lichenis]
MTPRLASLSHVLDPATVSLYPGDPPVEVTTVADDGFLLRTIRMGEHTGTHWGAPGHFTPGAALADDLDVTDLCRPAVKIDVRDRCAADPDHAVTAADLQAWESDHGRIPDESVVVLWTGWDRRWGTEDYYARDAAGVMHQPGFAPDAVRWLIETGRLGRRGGTGTDTFGPDLGTDDSFEVSRLVHQEHRISLECLANLEALPTTGAYVLCGGQIVRGGTGSPALIYALLPPA